MSISKKLMPLLLCQKKNMQMIYLLVPTKQAEHHLNYICSNIPIHLYHKYKFPHMYIYKNQMLFLFLNSINPLDNRQILLYHIQ